ncbi:periplasmic nitrate reductase, NapE protein [Saccharobesus litoralis]|uniref:Periplasmic nitrate reductase, NapE protein n=1 Tax=Saccharobesus litoralis TaxID=2172099 RepID=A0A2S0VRN6_9ALTE|nr:periplasmic nitrate reductase, NapE protein [Saccharobesus litoralis]AWB66868.1 periplasmic nitrate reductase, NapE protein [Saccharobesus litoralis]
MNQEQTSELKSRERNTFLFLTIFLAPILSIIIVGGYGFMVWISQLLFGPPGA